MRAGPELRWWNCDKASSQRSAFRVQKDRVRARDQEERLVFSSMPFEVLNFALVLFGFFHGVEGAKVAALARRGILLARIEAVFSGFEFADHSLVDVRNCVPAVCRLLWTAVHDRMFSRYGCVYGRGFAA